MPSPSPLPFLALALSLAACAAPIEADQGIEPDSDSADLPGEGTSCTVAGVAGTCMRVGDCTGEREATPGFCTGPTEVQCCTPLGSGDPDPDPAEPPNPDPVEEPGVGNCPNGMIEIDNFCVDKYEGTLVRNIDDTPWSPYHNPGNEVVRAVSVRDAVPQGYISKNQAQDACELAGKRLCSDDEWQRACKGPSSFIYPYGNVRQPGVCNDARSVHPAAEFFGTTADWIYSMLGDPGINQIPDSVARTGEHDGCESAEGPMDMMGNLHEWTSESGGTFRGGYYVDTVNNGDGCEYDTEAHGPSYWDYSTGFRCCADVL